MAHPRLDRAAGTRVLSTGRGPLDPRLWQASAAVRRFLAATVCCGVVVSSAPEGAGFRTVIHFADLGKDDASCLEALTKTNKMRCDYCANC